jgi:hypothetical protein
MKRGLCAALSLVLVAGCGTGSHVTARSLLIALTAGTAALAVGGAVKSKSIGNDLKRDLDSGQLTGQEFADRDASGTRWNRISRAAAFSSVVFLLGLGVVWQMGWGDRIQTGPRERTPADDPGPIFPPGEPAAAR